MRTEGVVVAAAVPVGGAIGITLASLAGVQPRPTPARAGIWGDGEKPVGVSIQNI